CAALVTVHPRVPALERWGDQPAMLILGAAIAGEIWLSLITPAGMYLRVGPMTYVIHHLLISAAAVLAGTQLSENPWLGRGGMVLLLGVHFALGLWVVNASPAPAIDVYVW